MAVSIFKPFLYLTGCVVFFITQANAQTRGRVEVVKDPRVDSLIAHKFGKAAKGSVGGNSGVGYSSYGYRVQIFTGSNRAEAFKAQSKFQESYPDTRTYISYSEPNFKVKVGDFRSRLEASKMARDVKPWFPLTFIISEKINPPKLDTETQTQ